MASEVFQLYLLLQLKDMASGGLNHVEAQLRSMGKEGKEALRTFQSLREGMKRDLTVAGIGIGTLAALKKGVDVAGDFEGSIADMRMSIEELGTDGKINVAKLNDELGKLEVLGVRIGNQLPGTTQDFIEEFSTLKQGGVATKDVIDGVGESVANLAVVTKEIPKQLAEPFAQYTQQFQLTGEEAKKLADVLARIQFSTGLRPQELIEGSKFFQLRAGSRLGLTGLTGADVSGRLLATLRSYGLEGGIGGRELSTFIGGLSFATKQQQKTLAELKKTKGIDFKLFDKKGELIGADALSKIENIFTQMEKLRALSTKEKLDFGNKLFGQEGAAIANTFMRAGDEGWRRINERIDKNAPLQELINQKTSTYNAKVEAVKGTLTNLEATVFLPMLDTLKPMLDTANDFTGALQGWAKEHPDIANYVTTFVAIGGVTLTLVGTVRAGTTAWGLYSIASNAATGALQGQTVAAAESTVAMTAKQRAMIALGASEVETAVATGVSTRALQAEAVAAGEATVATAGVNSRLLALRNMSGMRIGVVIAASYIGFEVIEWLRGKQQEYEKSIADAQQKAGEIAGQRATMRQGAPMIETQRALDVKTREQALEQWKGFQFGGPEVFSFLGSDKLGRWMGGTHPVLNMPTADYFQTPVGAERRPKLIEELRGLGGGALFNDRALLAALLKAGERGELRGVETDKEKESFKSIITEAFGNQRVAEALKLLADQSVDTANKTTEAYKGVQEMLTIKFPGSLSTAGDAAQRFADRLNNVDLKPLGLEPTPTPTPKAGGISYVVPAYRSDELRPQTARAMDLLTLRFGGVSSAAQRFSNRLDALELRSLPTAAGAATPFGSAISYVLPDRRQAAVNAVHTITRERIERPYAIPERRPAEFRPEVARAIVTENRSREMPVSSQKTVHVHPGAIQINLPAGRAMDDPAAIARAVKRHLEIEIERA